MVILAAFSLFGKRNFTIFPRLFVLFLNDGCTGLKPGFQGSTPIEWAGGPFCVRVPCMQRRSSSVLLPLHLLAPPLRVLPHLSCCPSSPLRSSSSFSILSPIPPSTFPQTGETGGKFCQELTDSKQEKLFFNWALFWNAKL